MEQVADSAREYTRGLSVFPTKCLSIDEIQEIVKSPARTQTVSMLHLQNCAACRGYYTKLSHPL